MVVFYTNDSASTPSEPLQGCNEESIMCVWGLAHWNRWFGNESMHQAVVQVPAMEVLYRTYAETVWI